MTRRSSTDRVASFVLAVMAWAAVGCGGGGHQPPPASDPAPVGALRSAVLTSDGSVRYRTVLREGALRITASGGPATGNNLREVLWLTDAPVTADQTACATWRRLDDPDGQQGVALRISVRGGAVRAVTVTKNTYLLANWAFNVHVWDTTRQPVLEQVGRVELEAAFRREGFTTVPLPWRMCARARGDAVDVKVWPLARPEPGWGDPGYGGTVDLPPGWDGPGRPGWYIGHLRVGAVAVYDDLVGSAGGRGDQAGGGGGGGGG